MCIYICEQNLDDFAWGKGLNYGRAINLSTNKDGSWRILDDDVLGWIRVIDDPSDGVVTSGSL